jgi:DNA mismatch repair ATPase MutS
MDEVGRGTATFDGLAIAMAVLEHLHNVNRCRTLFASHYHELHHLQASLPALGCHHMATERQADGSIVFLHKVLPGVVLQSYGVFVARLAGIPESVASRAEGLRASQDLYRGLIAAVFERGAGSTTQGQRQPAEAARQQQQQQGQTELQRQAERAP